MHRILSGFFNAEVRLVPAGQVTLYNERPFVHTASAGFILGGRHMKPADSYRLVLVSCANSTQAKLIARTVVEKRLAACVNVLRRSIDSYYRWKGTVEKASEVLLFIKTTEKKLASLEREVKRLHSYEVPEFIALPIVAGSRAYLDWLDENT
jgi:periplasmic divalent cation tolerance protein